MSQTDTIAAIATPQGRGGVGIVRISGVRAGEILQRVFDCGIPASGLEDRKLYLGRLNAEGFCDRCLGVIFRAPRSYTGEDVAELHCHGGNALIHGALRAALDAGARLAENGEFTRRAFLNGKLSLSGAEGLIEMIDAESEAELAAGYALLGGELNREAQGLQERLTDVLAETEAELDYPEEDFAPFAHRGELTAILAELTALNDSAATGRMVREGAAVAVVGRPNAGKSSLMNRLLSYDRAIVSPVAGTTRDTLEATLVLNGRKLRLVDTAGIREPADEVERMGVERAENALLAANVVLFVLNGCEKWSGEDARIAKLIGAKPVVAVFNKSDCRAFQPYELPAPYTDWQKTGVSALTGEGLDTLKEMLFSAMGGREDGGLTLTVERHIRAVRRARDSLESAIAALDAGMPDAAASQLHASWSALGEITGETATEEIIDSIFGKFCLGK